MTGRDAPDRGALYLVTDRHAARGDLVGAVEAALAGGLRALLLREKDLDPDELRALGRDLRARTAGAGAALYLSSAGDPRRIELADELGVDGVHLTGADLFAAPVLDALAALRARRAGIAVAASTHGAAELAAARDAGAELVTLGPVFDTPSKRGLGEPLGLTGFAAAAAFTAIPAYALGGVDADRAAGVVRSGARGVACIRAVLSAADPAAATRALIERVETARRASPAPAGGERSDTPEPDPS